MNIEIEGFEIIRHDFPVPNDDDIPLRFKLSASNVPLSVQRLYRY